MHIILLVLLFHDYKKISPKKLTILFKILMVRFGTFYGCLFNAGSYYAKCKKIIPISAGIAIFFRQQTNLSFNDRIPLLAVESLIQWPNPWFSGRIPQLAIMSLNQRPNPTFNGRIPHLTAAIVLSESIQNWYGKFCFGKSCFEMDCLPDVILIKKDDYEFKEFKGILTDWESKIKCNLKSES